MKIPALPAMQAMKLPVSPTPLPKYQMILMSMVLVCLLSLPLVFVYFLDITLSSLKSLSMKYKVNHQKDVICFKKICNKWVALIEKKNIEVSIKDGLIITITTTGIFYVLTAANVKPLKASLDAMDIMKLAGKIVSGVLVKDYAVYKKWIIQWYNKHFIALSRTIKLHAFCALLFNR